MICKNCVYYRPEKNGVIQHWCNCEEIYEALPVEDSTDFTLTIIGDIKKCKYKEVAK